MSDHWDFYGVRSEDGGRASIFVDLGLAEHAPVDGWPRLGWVFVTLRDPTPEGLCGEAEAERLGALEDALAGALDERADALFVGRLTGNGRRDFFFHTPADAPFETAAADVLERFAPYAFACGSRDDPDWSHYRRFLYPAADERLAMANRHLMEGLVERGDDLSQPRPVRHGAHFPSGPQRDAFVKRAEAAGYEVHEVLDPFADENALPFGVILVRTHPVHAQAIDALTSELLRLALAEKGEYDGWDSPVMV